MILRHGSQGIQRCMHPYVAQSTHTGTHTDPRPNLPAMCTVHVCAQRRLFTWLPFFAWLTLHGLRRQFNPTFSEKSFPISLNLCYMSLLCMPKILSPFLVLAHSTLYCDWILISSLSRDAFKNFITIVISHCLVYNRCSINIVEWI